MQDRLKRLGRVTVPNASRCFLSVNLRLRAASFSITVIRAGASHELGHAGCWSSNRIAEYRPLAIVSILLRIKDIVEAAAISAGSDAPRFAVPFPGVGQQVRFLRKMADILPRLPRVNPIG
jgi:hypothetical protein